MPVFDPNSPAASHEALADITAIRTNFQSLNSCEASASEPSNLVAGKFWYDTTANILKLRNEANTAWQNVWDFGNNRLPLNVLAPGELTADTAGRAKMADLFIINAKVNDVAAGKITGGTLGAGVLSNTGTVSLAALTAQTAGDILIDSSDTMSTTTSTAFVKVKAFRIPRGGTLRISFEIKISNSSFVAYGQIYRNGAAVGTLQSNGSTSFQFKTEDISGWAHMDKVQLYIKSSEEEITCLVQNFRISSNFGGLGSIAE